MSRVKGAPKTDLQLASTQVWHGVVDHLRLLRSVPSATLSTDELLAEKHTLDEAAGQLELLISLQRGETEPSRVLVPPTPLGPASSIASSVGGPSGSGSLGVGVGLGGAGAGGAAGTGAAGTTTSIGPDGRKRKRKSSISASPAPQSAPILGTVKSEAEHGLAASPPRPGAVSRSGTPMSREPTGKHRRDGREEPPVLATGRKVAFRQPAQPGEEENWILATIKRSLGDRNKYEVQDADDASLSWPTTLKSIIPLPTGPDARTDEYPRGAQVLGLYPETTSFYHATVVQPPSGGKKGMSNYLLQFVDDGDAVHEVSREMVVTYAS